MMRNATPLTGQNLAHKRETLSSKGGFPYFVCLHKCVFLEINA